MFRREERGAWCVRWREPGGAQRRASFASKAAAERKARELARAMGLRGKDGLGGLATNDARDLAVIREAMGGASVAQLLAVWERHKHEVVGRAAMPLADAVERYLVMRDKDWSADTFRHVRLHLRRLSERFTGDLGEVTAEGARRWLADMGSAGRSIWPHQKDAAAFFARAVREGWVSADPFAGIDRPKDGAAEEVSVLSPADAQKLFAACAREPVVVRLALEAFGGLRNASAQRLMPEDIRWSERGILLPADKHKSGRRHYLEGLPENLWAWLDAWRDRPEAWAWRGSQLMHAKSAAFTLAGVRNPKNVLRHSFASYHVALHQDAAKTALLMQHTGQVMLYRHYKGVATQADAEKYFAIRP